jgi:sialate O-acetylesterase
VDDFDVTYVNGNEVGRTGPETPSAYAKPRVYKVAAGCLRPGRNVIAVRVFDQWGGGGFAGSARAMRLIASDDPSRCIPLAGPWRMHIEHALRPWRTFSVDVSTSELYNGMVHPLRRSPIRGVLWYQGESDVGRADRYRLMFRDLILRWRAMWQDETLPFLFVQLAGFHPLPEVPGDDEWAELREAQATALALPNTGMAVALDVGNPEDIHPRNKRAVGERLALWALQMVHGEKSLEVSGPMLRTHGVRGSEIHVEFDHAAGLRTRDGGEVRGFQIVDDLGEHHWAEAVIQGDTVIVSHPNVRAPRAVRYGWSGSSLANVVNGAGLPAVPFRTDAP